MRSYIKEQADELGLMGRVENKEDGTVAVVAQGNEDNLKTFISALHKGSPLAQVETVEVAWGQTSNPQEDFLVIHDQANSN